MALVTVNEHFALTLLDKLYMMGEELVTFLGYAYMPLPGPLCSALRGSV